MEILNPLLSKETIVNYFNELGIMLKDRKVQSEIKVYGGTAMMVHYPNREKTRDVDGIVTVSHHEFLSATNQLNKKLKIPNWFNESVSIYTSKKESISDFDVLYFPESSTNLRVLIAKKPLLIAMKIQAVSSRSTMRDQQDLKLLMVDYSDRQIRDFSKYYFPEDPKLEVLHEFVGT